MAKRRRDYYNQYEDYAKPIETVGGIKAQSRRGAFGKSWWAKRWIDVLESFDIGARLARGKSYARKGQVTRIAIAKGLVKGQVQGSRPNPYQVTIRVAQLKKNDWKKLGEALLARVSFAARLLAGEMPDRIGDVFAEAGLSLFPEKGGDLETECNCPDWSNPCKHVAAVYYLIGEAFDSDPFLIFELRGLARKEIADLIGELPVDEFVESLPPEPLPLDPAHFWGAIGEPSIFETERPSMNAAFPKRLGSFPFWRGEAHFLGTLEDQYGRATRHVQRLFLGEDADE